MKPTRNHQSRKSLAQSLGVVGFWTICIVGCAPATTTAKGPMVENKGSPEVRTIGQILKSDPRFTDFIRVVDFAGLGHELDTAHGVTVFAPTNTAFELAEPNWRATANPDTAILSGGWGQQRQHLIEQSVLSGIHPPSDFAGKMQDVRAINGSVFHVDGRGPGGISITTGPIATAMGDVARPPRVANAQLPPIVARDGIIYPVDNILIR
jgi:uncharacterized surface protein with fasciclin (FAS1) repeats